MRSKPFRALGLLSGIALVLSLSATPAGAQRAEAAPEAKRTVVYYQTQYHNDTYVSPKTLLDNKTGVTDVLVGALHLNDDGTVTLNDHPMDHERYTRMWKDLADMKAAGVRVSLMVGGAAPGTFERLDKDVDTYYPKLKKAISKYQLSGVDLDVEESMSLQGIERVIDALHADFDQDFTISLAPVATALAGGGNLSGFDYEQLERDRGDLIDWYNPQFYCGWGDMSSTSGYDDIIERKVIPANKVVASTLTHPSLCGSGYVDIETKLKDTIGSLAKKYPDFGGVAGWEYFTSNPGDTEEPWEWARLITSYQRA